MNQNQKTDPFLLEILRYAFDSLAEELTLTIVRTAYSQIVRDSLDFSTAICDAQGRTIAQGVCTPMHLGAFYDALQCMIQEVGDDVHPEDTFIMNDPYAAVGQHLPDIYVVQPVFFDGKLMGWAATLAHHSDVGGIVAGSNSLGAHEIWQEGLRIPVLKLIDKGVKNETLWKMIALNVRTPDMVFGDLQAQIAACRTGVRGMQRMYIRYGVGVIEQAVVDLNAYAQDLAEAEISALQDGVYRFVDHIDGIGDEPDPVILNLEVTIDGSSVTVNWEGSSKQVAGGINSTFPFTKACAYAAIRSLMKSDVPNCYGFTVPISVVAEKGSVVYPVSPAPCGARGITGYRMIDCLFGALAQAAPDKVTADGSGGSTLPTISGDKDGKIFVFCETAMGTWGASSKEDGQEGMPHIGANQSNIPVEMIERTYPIRIDQYGFVPDSGGAGYRRGGMALRRDYHILADKVMLNIRSDKRDFPPHGLYGGSNGQPSSNTVMGVEKEFVLAALPKEPIILRKDDVFSHIMPSGGGYGPAWEREVDKVIADVQLGKVSVDGAQRDYGVVLTKGENGWFCDFQATASRRDAMAKEKGEV